MVISQVQLIQMPCDSVSGSKENINVSMKGARLPEHDWVATFVRDLKDGGITVPDGQSLKSVYGTLTIRVGGNIDVAERIVEKTRDRYLSTVSSTPAS